jgi:hypothetical protein
VACARTALMGLAAAVAALWMSPSARAQSAPQAAKPDAMTQAYLFGAAFRNSDLSHKAGGMMFLPGRGLIRWETRGKTLAEQEELKTEAIGLADARAVQTEIDAQRAALDQIHSRGEDQPDRTEDLAPTPSGRTMNRLNLASMTGVEREAGGVIPLNRASRLAAWNGAGVRDGSTLRGRNRVYMFGAVSGRAVGLNLLHDAGSGWRNAGLTMDKGGFIGQRQAGLAVRRGMAQAALSLVQEKTQAHILGMTSIKDHRAMLSLSLIPGLSH